MSAVTLKCPNCGGGLKFDPASQKYECEYCLSSFTQEELKKAEPQAEAGDDGLKRAEPQADDPAGGAVIYTCPSCGAELVTDGTTAASFCFYCHNPVILQGRLEGRYHPRYVLPFSIDKGKAREIFLSWLKKKKFVPKDFYSPDQIEKMTGVYFPYWLYSCKADGRMEAVGIKEGSSRIVGNTLYTEKQKFSIVRSGLMDIRYVTRNALKKADRKLVEGVMPFDMNGLKPFSMGYLSGFFAEKRDIESQECQQEVEEEVRAYAIDSLKYSVEGYDSLQVENQSVKLDGAVWDYALMPVWTLTYKDKSTGKINYFACNGQTGKVCGVLPIDRTRLAVFFARIFVPLFAALMAVMAVVSGDISWYGFLMALLVSGITAGGAAASVKSQYKMKADTRQTANYNFAYRADSQLKLAEKKDRRISTFTTTSPVSAGAAAAGMGPGGRKRGAGGGKI